METSAIETRLELLQTELHKANSNVISLTEQLEKARAQFHTISGHINESTYYLNQNQIKEDEIILTNGQKNKKSSSNAVI